MSSVSVVQSHQKPVEVVRALVDDLADELQTRHGLQFEWRGTDLVVFRRSGVSGQLQISQTEVAITLNLGFFASAFKHRIEQELRESMRERLA